jgi:endoglucanase
MWPVYDEAGFAGLSAVPGAYRLADARDMGFDHVRLAVNSGPFLAASPEQYRNLLAQLVSFVSGIRRYDLSVIVAMFAPFSVEGYPDPEQVLDHPEGPRFQRYADLIEALAGELEAIGRDGGTSLALELMNEPQIPCRAEDGPDWMHYQEALVHRIRLRAQELALFLTGGCWSSIDGAVLLGGALFGDPLNHLSVHFYEPFLFTHQTSTWTTPIMPGIIGLPYPAQAEDAEQSLRLTLRRFQTLDLTPDERSVLVRKAQEAIREYFQTPMGRVEVARRMGELKAWQERNAVDPRQIVFTEFGATRQLDGDVEIDAESRRRWLEDVSGIIEENGWGWTVHVLKGDPFGLYAEEDDVRPDPRLIRALGLRPLEE